MDKKKIEQFLYGLTVEEFDYLKLLMGGGIKDSHGNCYTDVEVSPEIIVLK